MQDGSFLKFSFEYTQFWEPFSKVLVTFLSSLCCVLSQNSMEITSSPVKHEPVCQFSKSTSWELQISKMTSWNNLISQNCPSKSKKWLYEIIRFLKIFKIPACEMIRFLKIVAFSLCLIVSYSKLHQQISKMALWNDPISRNFQNSSLLSLSKKTEKDPF